MKLAKSAWLARLALSAMACFLLLTATGCKKVATPASNHPALSPEQAKEQRLAWNLKTLVEPYEKAGHTSPKWDEPAKRALTEFARSRSGSVESNEAWGWIISTNCIAAVDAGCDDPMIHYLYVRFSMDQTNSAQAFTDRFSQTAKDMQQSTYPPVRKFYAAARAMDQIFYTYGTNTGSQAVWGEMTPLLAQNVEAALNDKTMPAREAYEIADKALYLISGDTNEFQQGYDCVKKPLLENWPDDYTTWLLKGTAYIHMAWHARGNGWAYTVTDKGWEHFGERLATAQEALEQAWKLNPKDPEIAHQMMTVMLGQGGGRDRMELWFNRAMMLDPDDYDACSKKLYYLEPKWYGSREAMLNFGRECVQNTNWAGKVPLVLVDAHWNYCRGYIDKSEQTNYWKQPDVWPDIKSAYARYFQLYPDATGTYEYYAWYAYQAGQWDTLNELIPKLGPETYYRFGGKDEFDKMVRQAKEHTNGSKVEESK
jgi:tetratricopeptide (TPR) repeat protein